MDDLLLFEEDSWKCRKHSSQPLYGVCPACLRHRLLLLCPDCANARPCGCFPSSSSSSSSSSLSSTDLARPGTITRIGSVGRVSHLIDAEPALRRSRSAAFPFLRPRSDPASDSSGDGGGDLRRPPRRRGWTVFWPFKRRKEEDKSVTTKLSRSRSVGVASYSDSGVGEGKLKGWNWYFPSPMKVLRHRKTAKIVQERSPMCRG